MTVTLYADVYFILNMLFDTLFLYITARITNTPFKLYRILLGGVFGTMYAFFCLLVKSFLLLNILSAVLICFMVFGKKRLLLNTAVFFLSSALTGGTVYGIFHLAGKSEESIASHGYFGATVCVLAALALTAGYMYVCKKNSSSGAVHAYITVMGKEFKAFLMKDNGNMLTDPISMDPVIIISKTVFGKCFDNVTSGEFPLPMRIIPVKTAAGSDILYGFRPEKCEVREFGRKGKRKVRAIIAISSGNRFANTYDGLMPPI